jgi:hypothetical protein
MKLLVGTFIVAVSCGFAAAQQERKKPDVVYTPVQPAQAGQVDKPAKVMAELAAARSAQGGVRNAPFSADEINESVQTLADGNRIVRNTTGKIYRNSAGRVRRDAPGGTGGMLGSTYSVAPAVTILDSAAGFRYQLDNNLKIAQQSLLQVTPDVRVNLELAEAQRAVAVVDRAKAEIERAKAGEVLRDELARTPMPMPAPVVAPMPPVALIAGDTGQVVSGAMSATTIHPTSHSKYETRTEDLGVQSIEGVEAKGTRTTTIIPANAIGNERPIEIVYERWYSEELKMIVYSKRSDPRSGEQTYRLTNINRSEPDPALFSVSGYRLVGPAKKTSPIATTAGEKGKPVKSPYIKNFMPNN